MHGIPITTTGYLMQTGGRTDLSLRLQFWGVGEWKTHEFDIFVDNELLTSVNNTGKYRISEFKYGPSRFPPPCWRARTRSA